MQLSPVIELQQLSIVAPSALNTLKTGKNCPVSLNSLG